ncbi:MAG: glycogen debranching protein GlgX [Arcanobacterium sp.]
MDQTSLPAFEDLPAEPAQDPIINPIRLGPSVVDGGVDFVVAAPHATAVYVCLIDEVDGELTERRYALSPQMYGLWAGHISGIGPGQKYGLRADGPWNPASGHRYNVAKLLLDPYARAIAQVPTFHSALYPHEVDENYAPIAGLEPNNQDSLEVAAIGVVVADQPNNTQPLRIPWDQTVIYEAHVIGLTKLLTSIPEELRGTYAGVAHPATIAHLKNLGITTIELLPIHAKMSEPFLSMKDMENYWGYNTLSFFAPEPSYAMASNQALGPQAVLDEVKGMIKLLHDAGIEVILDVVYNHSCEGGVEGPSLSWRGLDSTIYYRHDSAHPSQFKDTTGCGNSFDFRRHVVLQMTLDSLRYWVADMGVDGFRFDLAVTLGREGDHFNHNHPLYMAMATDPILSTVKLINEPWDMGYGGWRTGQFQIPTADWNDRFRDTLRSFWVAEAGSISHGGHGSDPRDLATRMAGSADMFGYGRIPGGRGVHSTINFITAHDGFTMADLCSYNHKHNEANCEDNRDGTDNNRSWNHGVEGPSDNPVVRAARRKTVRNLMGSLILAAGTPMLAAGDEILKTQGGNNNAYCQNSMISWIDWELDDHQRNMLATTAHLLRLRREHSVLRPTKFYTGADSDEVADLEWLSAEGERLDDFSWFDPSMRLLQMLRSGHGEDVDALLVINGLPREGEIRLPWGRGNDYVKVWASEWENPNTPGEVFHPGERTSVAPLSLTLYFTIR